MLIPETRWAFLKIRFLPLLFTLLPTVISFDHFGAQHIAFGGYYFILSNFNYNILLLCGGLNNLLGIHTDLLQASESGYLLLWETRVLSSLAPLNTRSCFPRTTM